jgi:GTP cyclohydrolase III
MVSSQYLNISNSSAELVEVSPSISIANLYKVYASAEVNAVQKKFTLEIIDGFLRGNERLSFLEHKVVSDFASILIFDITQSSQLNTYYKSEVMSYVNSNHKIFILVKKNNKMVGYQYIGLDNEIIPEVDQKILSKLL